MVVRSTLATIRPALADQVAALQDKAVVRSILAIRRRGRGLRLILAIIRPAWAVPAQVEVVARRPASGGQPIHGRHSQSFSRGLAIRHL